MWFWTTERPRRSRILERHADAVTVPAITVPAIAPQPAVAHNQIERQSSSQRATQRLVRQEEITEEIIEPAAGETASRTGRA
jgi:hypothetical protein